MARGRMVYRDIFHSADVVTLPAAARWLWLGLVVLSDDDGRMRVEPHHIQRTICVGLRLSERRLESYLSLFSSRRMLDLYTVDGQKYVQLRNFHKWQKLKFRRTGEHPSPEHEDEGEDEHTTERADAQVSGVCPASPGPEEDSEPAWREFGEIARRQSSIRNPDAFLASKRAKHRHPDETGCPWWLERRERAAKEARRREREKPKDTPAPASAEEAKAMLARSGLRKKAGAGGKK